MFLSYKRCYISYHTYYREPKATKLCPECKSPPHTRQEPSKTVPSRTPKPYHQKPRQKTKKTKQNVTFCRVVFPFLLCFWRNGLGDTAGYDFGCGGTVSGCMARAAKVQPCNTSPSTIENFVGNRFTKVNSSQDLGKVHKT